MFEKFSSFSMRSRSRHTFLLFVGEASWNQLCKNFPHAQFLGQDVMDSLVIQIQLTNNHAVKSRSDLMTALTMVTFSSVFDVQDLPERGLSSTLSQPSKNSLCHLKPCALDSACFP